MAAKRKLLVSIDQQTGAKELSELCQSIVKAADETLNTSTTLQADDELKIHLLSGDFKLFEMTLVVSADHVDPDMKLRLAAADGLTGNIEYRVHSIGGDESVNLSDFTTDTGQLALTTAKSYIRIYGAVEATEDGTLQLEWAQFASNANDVTVHKLSSSEARWG